MRRISGFICLLEFVLALIPLPAGSNRIWCSSPTARLSGNSTTNVFMKASPMTLYGGRKPVCCCRGRAEYPLLWALAYADLLYTAGAQEYSNVNLANYGG